MWRGGRGLTRNIETKAVPVLIDSYMNILVLNSGSSTLKFQLIATGGGRVGKADHYGRFHTTCIRYPNHEEVLIARDTLKFIESSEAARQDDECAGTLHEHDFAGKKVMKKVCSRESR